MNIDVEKVAGIVAKDGPSLGMMDVDGEPALGVLWFQPADVEKVKAFFPSLTGAKVNQ